MSVLSIRHRDRINFRWVGIEPLVTRWSSLAVRFSFVNKQIGLEYKLWEGFVLIASYIFQCEWLHNSKTTGKYFVADPEWLRVIAYTGPNTQSQVWVPPMLMCAQARGSKKLRCNTGNQELSRCCTRGESKDSNTRRKGSTQLRPYVWNLLLMQTEVQNRSIRGPTKKDWCSPKFKKNKLLFCVCNPD